MKAMKYLLFGALGAVTVLAVGATLLDAGIARAEEPQGVKLRQESAQRSGFFHNYRSHRGGGLRGGK